MKKVLTIFLCICFITLGTVEIFASDIGEHNITPRMDYISSASSDIAIDKDGNATINCSVYGYQTITTKVSMITELQKYIDGKWVATNIYNTTNDSYRADMSKTVKVVSGYKYRVVLNAKAYSGTNVESKTVISGEAEY